MRHLLIAVTATAALASAAPLAAAQQPTDQVPAPQPITITLGHTKVVQLSDGGGGLPYLNAPASINAGALTAALTTFHDSGAYDAELAQIDAVAARWVARKTGERQVASGYGARARTARRAHPGHWWRKKLALVLDIDETSLSNYSAIVADGFTYGTNSMNEAVNQVGVAIAPTLALYRQARAAGVDVFFITGRGEAQRAPTESNLRREGYDGWKQLVLKPTGFQGSTVYYKSSARAAIEQQGYRIIASVGDQYSDLAGGHEDRGFKLPNPFYYLP